MKEKAKKGRDAFTFSLHGMTAIASFTLAPAIADDRINKIRDEQVKQPQEDQPKEDQGRYVRAIEDVLARYFALGCCRVA